MGLWGRDLGAAKDCWLLTSPSSYSWSGVPRDEGYRALRSVPISLYQSALVVALSYLPTYLAVRKK